MDCETVSELLQQYHEGEIKLKENPELTAHVKECPSCRDSFQKILFDVDLAVYMLVMGDVEPPEDFSDKVIEAIPGGEEKKSKPGRKAGSSGRLPSVGSGDRKEAPRKSRPPSRGAMKPVRRTTVIKRRGPGVAESGIFLQDQIFGTQEKKKGMVITYCEECGERINPQDFESGVAVTYKDASYCKNCKSEVMEFIEQEAGPASPKKDHKHKPARPAASRGPAPRGPMAAPRKPLNLPLIGGVLMGAAALIIVVVVVIAAVGSGDGSQKKTTTGNVSSSKGGKSDVAGKASAGQPDSGNSSSNASSLDEQIKAREAIEKKKAEEEAEAKRKALVPSEKLAAWRDEAEKILTEAGNFENFEKALSLWGTKQLDMREGKVPDDKAPVKGTMVTFTEEHFDEIERERQSVIARWENHVKSEAEKVMGEAFELSKQEKYAEAIQKLEEWVKAVPEAWTTRFAEHVDRVKGYVETTKMTANRAAEAAARQAVLKNKRMITEIGTWVELIKGKDDFSVNWGAGAKQEEGGKVSWDDEEKTVTLVGRGTNIIPVFGESTLKWVDYEIEFQMKAKGQMIMFARFNRSKSEIRVPFESMPQWATYRVKVEGVSVELYVNGEKKGEGVVDVQAGPPVFLALDSDGVVIKGVKVMVKKTA